MKRCIGLVDISSGAAARCENLVEGTTDFCAHHNRENRKSQERYLKQLEKREQQLKKAKEKSQQPRQKVKKVSPKREELNKEYFKLVEQFKKDNPLCKANVNEYCTKDTDDPHHKRGRGIYLLDVSTWMPVCRSCHSFITAHPKEAIEKGFSESRLAKPKIWFSESMEETKQQIDELLVKQEPHKI